MAKKIVLASQSTTRIDLLKNANVDITAAVPISDEEKIKSDLLALGCSAAEISLELARNKANSITDKYTEEAVIIGSDQVLEFEGQIISKSKSVDEAKMLFSSLSGNTHRLNTSVTIVANSKEVFSFTGVSEMTMAKLSDAYIQDYFERNWNTVKYSVGCYHLEGEGARLFTTVKGNYFHILGLPLIEVLNYLSVKGWIDR